MFGIDLGINIGSVSCITKTGLVLDSVVIHGPNKDKEDWTRIINVVDYIVDAIDTICRSHPGMIIDSQVGIEEPVGVANNRNPKPYKMLCYMFALTKNKLTKRGFTVYDIHPLSAKSIAKTKAFSKLKLKKLLADHTGKLTKKGMIRAYQKLIGNEPEYHTILGRETLADSYFIALSALEKQKMLVGIPQ